MSALVPWGYALLVAAALWGPRTGLVRTRAVLALAALAFAAGAWRRREELVRGGYARAALLAFAASLAVTAAPFAMVIAKIEPTAVAERLAYTLIGWCLFLWLPPLAVHAPASGAASSGAASSGALGETRATSDGGRGWLAPALLGLAALAILALAHRLLLGDGVLVHDEALYRLQARWLGSPGYAWRFDRELEPFFRLILTDVRDGRMVSQYPPGWGVLLAGFVALGIEWWSGAVLGAAAVVLTYLLGRRLHSHRAGLIAGALLATQHWFIEWSAGYFSHGATTMLAAAGGWLLLEGEARRGRARAIAWVSAGLALGGLLTIRPLTAVTLGVSLVLWLALRRRLAARDWGAMVGLLALGGLGPALWLLHYNQVTTGSPLVFGYHLVNGDLHALGFGTRGYRGVDPTGAYVTLPYEYTVMKGVRRLVERAWDAAHGLVPLALLVPIVLAGVASRYRVRWATVAAFLLTPGAYFFYFNSEIRFFTELLPFLYAGIAVILCAVWARSAGAARALVTGLLAASVLFAATWQADRDGDPWTLGSWYIRFRASLADFDAVAAARERHGKVVVFVREPTAWNPTLGRLFVLNAEGLAGDVVVARDLGPRNGLLMRRLPGHTPLLLTWDGDERHAATLEPLPRVGANVVPDGRQGSRARALGQD